MPEEVTPAAQTPVATPVATPDGAAPSAQPQADPQRQAIQDKYDALYQQAAPPEPTPVVPVETPAPTPASFDPNSFRAEILNAIKEMITPAAPQQAPQAAVPVAQQADWLQLLAEGKKAEGEAALRATLGIADPAQVVEHAVERVRAEQEIQSFTSAIRQDPANAEILRMEPYIASAVQSRLNAANAAGKINTPTEYVKIYKEALTAEMVSARNLILTIRGEGKQQAAVRQTEVLAAPMLAPSAINQNREPVQPQAELSSEQVYINYMQARQQNSQRARGLVAAA